MRTVAVATFARSEWGTCLPVLRAIAAEPTLRAVVIVGGMHLAPEFGETIREIEAAGVEIAARVDMLLTGDTPLAAAKSIGLGTLGLADHLERLAPDLLFVAGDRLELLAAASAALALKIPLAHHSGGEVTEGALDNQVRNAVTKLAHLHFVALSEHRDRLLQMGEEPWRVTVTGEPALDVIPVGDWMGREELAASLGMELRPPVVVATLHPATLGTPAQGDIVAATLIALEELPATVVFTAPNADPEHGPVLTAIRAFVDRHRERCRLVASLGQRRYHSLLAQADLMVGNSSAAILEAPSFKLPAVNVGERQRGRTRAANVIDAADAGEVAPALRRALAPEFRASLADLVNPYGDGRASERIVAVLKEVDLGPALLAKRFVDRPTAALEPTANGGAA